MFIFSIHSLLELDHLNRSKGQYSPDWNELGCLEKPDLASHLLAPSSRGF